MSPVLARKPGARRNGAPFKNCLLPSAMQRIRRRLTGSADGDRQMVTILAAVLSHDLAAAEAACAEALREATHSADVVTNIFSRRREPAPPVTILTSDALRLHYDPPSRALLGAERGRVISASGISATRSLPLVRTPLLVLLAAQIVLSDTVTVVLVCQASRGDLAGLQPINAADGATAIEVTLRSTERSGGQGQLSLLFLDGPLALRGLMLIDAHGDTTRLSLSDVQVGAEMDVTFSGFSGLKPCQATNWTTRSGPALPSHEG